MTTEIHWILAEKKEPPEGINLIISDGEDVFCGFLVNTTRWGVSEEEIKKEKRRKNKLYPERKTWFINGCNEAEEGIKVKYWAYISPPVEK